VKTLHRVDEALVRQEIEAAGFVLKKEGQFLRNPDDDLSWSASPSKAGERRGTSDRFVLLYEKPAG
jgi:predicted methyltransferase